MLPVLAVGIGGALGASCRYLVVMLAQNIGGIHFPYGTFVVNILGAFIAGYVVSVMTGRWSGEETARLLLISGFCGGFTTFSSFAVESMLLLEKAEWFKFGTNFLINNLGSLGSAFLGAFLAKYH